MRSLKPLTIAVLCLFAPVLPATSQEGLDVPDTLVGYAIKTNSPDGGPPIAIEAFCANARWYKFGDAVPLSGTYIEVDGEFCVNTSGANFCRRLTSVGNNLFAELISGKGAPLLAWISVSSSEDYC